MSDTTTTEYGWELTSKIDSVIVEFLKVHQDDKYDNLQCLILAITANLIGVLENIERCTDTNTAKAFFEYVKNTVQDYFKENPENPENQVNRIN